MGDVKASGRGVPADKAKDGSEEGDEEADSATASLGILLHYTPKGLYKHHSCYPEAS